MTDRSDGEVARIEKTAVGPIEAYQLDQIRQEVELIAVDSLPKLDMSTVRIEQIDRLDDGMREITISGKRISRSQSGRHD